MHTAEAVVAAVRACQADDHQVVTFAVLGHKADLAFMVLGNDWRSHRAFQTAVQRAARLDGVEHQQRLGPQGHARSFGRLPRSRLRRWANASLPSITKSRFLKCCFQN